MNTVIVREKIEQLGIKYTKITMFYNTLGEQVLDIMSYTHIQIICFTLLNTVLTVITLLIH